MSSSLKHPFELRTLQVRFKTVIATLALVASSSSMVWAADGEDLPTDEAQAITKVVELIRTQVQTEAEKEGRAFRDAHRKHHGCVKAEFEVLPNLASDLAKGLFAKPAKYSAWVRYSNGSGKSQDDNTGDGRGMAVKVLGVPGPRLLSEFDDETTSQDFLMINHPVFFVRNAIDYVSFQEAVVAGKVLMWLMSPSRIFHEGALARALQSKPMVNPLDSSYFSMTASKIADKQMKFSVVPCADGKFANPAKGVDFLGDNLTATLANNTACFMFRVQLRTHPEAMPIEDPTIEWSEAQAPFVNVAKITIAKQKPEKGELCEAMSFNPWNGLVEHRPLGGISRARKAVYQEISRLRHGFNKQKRVEPSAN